MATSLQIDSLSPTHNSQEQQDIVWDTMISILGDVSSYGCVCGKPLRTYTEVHAGHPFPWNVPHMPTFQSPIASSPLIFATPGLVAIQSVFLPITSTQCLIMEVGFILGRASLLFFFPEEPMKQHLSAAHKYSDISISTSGS